MIFTLLLFLLLSSTTCLNVTTFPSHYLQRCRAPIPNSVPPSVWDQQELCHNPENWKELPGVTAEDLLLRAPKYVSPASGTIIDPGRDDHLTLPSSVCVVERDGYFSSTGLLLDCNAQYPLVMPRGRSDISMELRGVQPRATSPSPRVIIHNGPVFSLILPYNDMFGHVFTTAVSLAAQVLPLVMSSNDSVVLVPEAGALMSVLLASGLPRERILALSKPHYVYSQRAILFLRKAPFNVITSHWPARSAAWLRGRLRDNLWRQLKLNSTSSAGPSEAARKWVVVLCRPRGARYLANEETFLAAVKKALKNTKFSLFVFGRDDRASPISSVSPSAWLDTAAVFLQAVAVIGVHGSAFGNAILCHPQTVIVEVNAPWAARQQDDANDRPATRDAIMSALRAAGSLSYYNVYPLSLYAAVAAVESFSPPTVVRAQTAPLPPHPHHKPHGGAFSAALYSRFYSDANLVINPEHVLTILRRHGIAAPLLAVGTNASLAPAKV